jgi:ketosteroid isomerase-like protein
MNSSHEAVVRTYLDAVNGRDYEAIEGIFAEDADQEWPGSGEFIRGRAAIGAVTRATPSLPRTHLHRLRSDGELTIAEWAADYGDGKNWEVASVFEFRDDKVVRKTDYFVSGIQPPERRRGMTDVLRWPGS